MTDTKFQCAVRADLFARAWAAVSTEDTRYYLGGVYVQPCAKGGAIMTATDGHWLMSVHDPRAVVEGAAIVRLEKKMVAALKPGRQDPRRSHYGHSCERVLVVRQHEVLMDSRAMVVINGRPSVIDGVAQGDPRSLALDEIEAPTRNVVEAQFYESLIDGTFPDWTRVVPEEVDFTARVPDLDQRLVEKASRALAPSIGKVRAVKMAPKKGDAFGPVMVVPAFRPPEDYGALAVIMPIRTDTTVPMPTYWRP